MTDPALAVLDEMRDGRQGELIFTNPDGEAFSENAMLAVLDRLPIDLVRRALPLCAIRALAGASAVF
ncbi:hypothetical protein [Bradyrhizobium sp. 141]|uniref:hypothetical protein n=1 Tax=Bradyrhizobium sp. 141 TaxID=2782617 RepID=UPI001FFB63BA|nr:hypothetical protein [Bradyrhizobium sp. 141]MCK1719799.1 hypothetical protein [Bradyrhizobium sp. 141]